MSKWDMIKLSDVFTLQMGKTPSRDNPDYWNGAHKWVSIADLGRAEKYICDTKENITDSAISETGIKATPKGTVVMSFKLSIGKTAITSEDIYTNEAIMSFIDRQTYSYDIDYIYHLFSGKDWSEGTNKAVKGATLNKATLSQIVIPLPPIETQRQIAENLDKVTRFIDLCNSILDRLDLLVKSRFVEMFGDPEINPMNWKGDVLSKHLDVIGGYAFKSDSFKDSGIPVLRIGNINAGFFRPVNLVFWEDDIKLDRYKVYPGDLVMSLTGTVGKDDYGNVCILDSDYDVYYLNQRNAKLELHSSLDKIYLTELLKFDEIKKRLTGISRGVRQANISNRDIFNLCVPIPALKFQTQFATFVEHTNKSKSAVKKVLEKAETLKRALMQEYFG